MPTSTPFAAHISSVHHATFVVERAYPASPERVFAAFADPARKIRWYTDRAKSDVESSAMDFRVGGFDHASFRFKPGSPFPGVLMVNNTVYQDIVPGRRIVHAYTMTIDGRCISASLGTTELLPENAGTRLVYTEQAAFFEGADGPAIREQGWQTLLEKLSEDLAR